MTDTVPFDIDALTERATVDAERLRAEGIWSLADDVELDAAFGRAAVAALRAPVLAERSVRLRRIAKAVVPRALRPVLRTVVAHLDEISRRVASPGGSRGR